jgi:mannose/cellobiose epimerase-like protein (N-acyl-D-glucosamine 2-epimerase family)
MPRQARSEETLELEQLQTLASRLNAWLTQTAYPLWWEQGADHRHGGYHELLGLDGRPIAETPRRARVQSRQSYSYAMAGELGWPGPWREAAPHGLDYLISRYQRGDGEFCTLVSCDGRILDTSRLLYDQAFALLAMAWVYRVLPDRHDLKARAHALLGYIRQGRSHKAGGFVESSARRFMANPHMHLLEAALAWCEVESGTVWDTLADEIVELCLAKFIDREGGFLREFFDENWQPASGDAGHIIEPGHQFEWTWLIERWARMRDDGRAHAAALRLYEAGVRGVDPVRQVAVEELSDDFRMKRPRARLWAQTEHLKAALIMSENLQAEAREQALAQAYGAAVSLWNHLQTPTPGVWRDKVNPDGTFVEEPAPASSFYHIVCCISSLNSALGAL